MPVFKGDFSRKENRFWRTESKKDDTARKCKRVENNWVVKKSKKYFRDEY